MEKEKDFEVTKSYEGLIWWTSCTIDIAIISQQNSKITIYVYSKYDVLCSICENIIEILVYYSEIF